MSCNHRPFNRKHSSLACCSFFLVFLGPSWVGLGGLLGRLGGSQGVLGPPDTPAVKVTNRNKPKAMEHKSNKTEICYMWEENPLHVTNRCMKQKMKQKRHSLHFQANSLLHVRKTHKTIHVTNRCMKQKMKQNRNLLHRSNSRTHAFFLAPPGTAPRLSKARPFGGCEVGRGTWRGVDCGARCGAGRASQIAGERAAPTRIKFV